MSSLIVWFKITGSNSTSNIYWVNSCFQLNVLIQAYFKQLMQAKRNTAFFQQCLADLTRFNVVVFQIWFLKKVVLSYVIQHLNDKLIHMMRFIYINFHNDLFKNFISTSSYIFFSFNAACYFLENSFAVELLISFEKYKCICKQNKNKIKFKICIFEWNWHYMHW